MPVMRNILDFLFPPRDAQALVNEAGIETLGAFVRSRAHDAYTVSLLPYRNPLVRACILEAKFRDNGRAQQLLAAALHDYLKEPEDDDVIFIPLPLSSERFKERGYNQTERILQKAGVPMETGLLVRTHNTLPQTSLGKRARRKNMHEAFSLTRAPDPARTYIVFDDVLTTGATLRAAASALRDAGAPQVLTLALAH